MLLHDEAQATEGQHEAHVEDIGVAREAAEQTEDGDDRNDDPQVYQRRPVGEVGDAGADDEDEESGGELAPQHGVGDVAVELEQPRPDVKAVEDHDHQQNRHGTRAGDRQGQKRHQGAADDRVVAGIGGDESLERPLAVGLLALQRGEGDRLLVGDEGGHRGACAGHGADAKADGAGADHLDGALEGVDEAGEDAANTDMGVGHLDAFGEE